MHIRDEEALRNMVNYIHQLFYICLLEIFVFWKYLDSLPIQYISNFPTKIFQFTFFSRKYKKRFLISLIKKAKKSVACIHEKVSKIYKNNKGGFD